MSVFLDQLAKAPHRSKEQGERPGKVAGRYDGLNDYWHFADHGRFLCWSPNIMKGGFIFNG